MKKTTRPLLLLALVLFACSPRITSTPEPIPAQPATDTAFPQPGTNDLTLVLPEDNRPTGPKIIVTVGTPHIDPGPNGELPSTNVTPQIPSSGSDCAFSWAYQDLPELSATFDSAVTAIIPNSTSHASAFGENCMGAGGEVIRFGAMETDFYVIVTVTNLNDDETFGNWIFEVMQTVSGLPPDMLMGPNPGFVEFTLEKSTSERIVFRVPIRQFNESANGMTGEELFRTFYPEP